MACVRITTPFECCVSRFTVVGAPLSLPWRTTQASNSVLLVTASTRPPRKQFKFTLNQKPERKLVTEQDKEASSESALSIDRNPNPNGELQACADDVDDDAGMGLEAGPDHRSGYVALIGKPNVGKSTLMNQIVGQKLSIVTSKPQTTRHRILGICSDSSYQMILFDTPGVIRKKMHKLDDMMMKNVRSAAINADCVIVVVDASQIPEKIEDMLEEGAKDVISNRPTVLVLNKRDLLKPGELSKRMEWYKEFGGLSEIIALSAKYGQGIDDLKSWLVSKLPLGPVYYPKDYVSNHPEKFFAAEIVREKIFMQYFNEVPYASQVNVVTYVERDPPAKDFIQIEIVVERDSQKGIMIGKDGAALKTLATAARLDIEDFLGREAYLEVNVKVKENWRKNENLLENYGYSGELIR